MKRIYNTIIFLAMAVLTLSCASEEYEVLLTGLEISPNSHVMAKGETTSLDVVFTPGDIKDKSVQFSTSREDIITVDGNGVVYAHNVGTAVITAVSGGLMARCNVTVTASAAENISLDTYELRLTKGDLHQFRVSVSPENAVNSPLSWKTSDESVAVVDKDGLVMGKKEGTALITVALGEISASCEVTVYSKVNIGDFFYSDGTWSSELDNAKQVVGVVFYAGNPSADDSFLKQEHPECVNGLAVALNQQTETKYMPDYSNWRTNSGYNFFSGWVEDNTDYDPLRTGFARGDAANRMLGYNNTKAMLDLINAFPDYQVPPISGLLEFRKDNPLPENTSGWYMPSIKELYIMIEGYTDDNIFYIGRFFQNMEQMNSSLSKVDGTQLLDTKSASSQGEGFYWSSTEYYNAGYMCFMNSVKNIVPGGLNVSYTANTVRYVFAF